MRIWQKFNLFNSLASRWKSALHVSVFGFLVLYFIIQAFTGDNGYRAYLIIRKEVDGSQRILDKLQKELELLSRKVALLSNKSLDLDILEERCRAVLNYCYPDDVIIRSKTLNNQS